MQGEDVSAPAVTVANADAERTLLRIKQKLEGVEAGEGSPAKGQALPGGLAT